MQLNHVRDLVGPPVCLSLLYSYMIHVFDAVFIYDHYHEQSISYKFHPNRLYACWVVMHAFSLSAVSFDLSFSLN